MDASLQILFLAAAVFLASHVGLSTGRVREGLVGILTRRGFLVFYSLVSLAALGFVGWAYGNADYVEVWPQTPWSRLAPVIIMPFACILFVAGLFTADATLTSDGAPDEDGGVRGILKITRHPLMWAFILWALAHIPPNGDVAALILFVTVLILAVLGMKRLDAKHERAYGAKWALFQAKTSVIPFAATAEGRNAVTFREIGIAKIAGGLILYAALLYAHGWIFGVSVF